MGVPEGLPETDPGSRKIVGPNRQHLNRGAHFCPHKMVSQSFVVGLTVLIIVAAGATFLVDSTGSPPISSQVSSQTPSQSETASTGPANTIAATGQPIISVIASDFPSSIAATGGDNVTVSCQGTATTGATGQ